MNLPEKPMSATPRTDAIVAKQYAEAMAFKPPVYSWNNTGVGSETPVDVIGAMTALANHVKDSHAHARSLERELAEAKAEIERTRLISAGFMFAGLADDKTPADLIEIAKRELPKMAQQNASYAVNLLKLLRCAREHVAENACDIPDPEEASIVKSLLSEIDAALDAQQLNSQLTYCGRCDEDTPTNAEGKCPVCTKYKAADDSTPTLCRHCGQPRERHHLGTQSRFVGACARAMIATAPEPPKVTEDGVNMLARIAQEMRREHDAGDGHFSTEEVVYIERLAR